MTTPFEAVIVVLALTGSILNANKRVEGFWFWLSANGLAIWLFINAELYLMALLYGIYCFICIYGIWRWEQ